MAKYFNFFPLTEYRFSEKDANIIATKITSRFSFEEELKENTVAYYKYTVKDGETPEMLAHRFYGSSEKHWVILMVNNIIDPLYDWVLEDRTFNEYVKQKYSTQGALVGKNGIEWAKTNTHSYYKIISQKADNVTTQKEITIDEDTYLNTPSEYQVILLADGNSIEESISKRELSYFDYEKELNEQKRNIKILKRQFLEIAQSQFESIFNE